jgi:hypothetical protein
MACLAGQSSPEFLALAAEPPSGDPVKDRETTLKAYRICVEPDPVHVAALTAMFQADRAPNQFLLCIPAVIASTITGISSSPTHVERLQSLEMPTLDIHGTGDLAIALAESWRRDPCPRRATQGPDRPAETSARPGFVKSRDAETVSGGL